MNSTAKSETSLKLSSVAFAILWSGWMIWWSGDFGAVNIVGLTITGVIVGYLWYRVMRWQFRRKGLLPRENAHDSSAN